jgi:ribonuclease P protein component
VTLAPARRERFPKEVRLRRRPQFLKVQSSGHKLSTDAFLALVLPNARPDGTTRLGLTVSSKVGNAVVRNRIRRRLRELFRTQRERLPKGLDVVLIARAQAAEATPLTLTRAWGQLLAGLSRRYAR